MVETAHLTVHAQPRSKRTEVAGLHADAVKIRLAAPPTDGAANKELIAFLAATFGVPKSNVEIVSGATSRRKHVRVLGLTSKRARNLLGIE